MNTEGVEVTIVYPAYNEASRIERAVDRAIEEISKVTTSFEIIIAEDGSSDGTDSVAERLSREHSQVRHLHSDERLGRGKALNRAFKQSQGSILIYMDVDLSTEVGQLQSLINSIRRGNDIVTGSRMLPGSVVSRSRGRMIASSSYNRLIRFLFETKVRDHQCGFKAFNKRSINRILDEVEDTHWFWDTEILVVAAHHGYKIEEIPVNWVEGSETKVRILKDSAKMGFQALRLWWRLNSTKKKQLAD